MSDPTSAPDEARPLRHGPPPVPLRTERLVLRPATPDDLGALLEYWSDPVSARYVPFPPLDRTGAFRRLGRILGETAPAVSGEGLVLVVELDGHVVGDVTLRLKTGEPASVAELGWILHPAYAGRGIAFEAATAMAGLAFGHYGCHRVEAHLDPRNERSAALCVRLGMTLEAHLRRDYYVKDEWSDTAIYGLLREEWPAP